jgi:hypothetical protein
VTGITSVIPYDSEMVTPDLSFHSLTISMGMDAAAEKQ